jgi:hypothetical protein
MLTYKLPEKIRQIALKGEYEEFVLNYFFRRRARAKKA